MYGSSTNHNENIPFFFVCKKLIGKQTLNHENEIWHMIGVAIVKSYLLIL